MKKATIIHSENHFLSPWLTHYTLVYRGREYTETLQGEDAKNRYSVGDVIYVDTYKSNGNLCFVLKGKCDRI